MSRPAILGITGSSGKTSVLKILSYILKNTNFRFQILSSASLQKPGMLKKIKKTPAEEIDLLLLELSPEDQVAPGLKTLDFHLLAVTNTAERKKNAAHPDNTGRRNRGSLLGYFNSPGPCLINADDSPSLQLADIYPGEIVTFALHYPNAMVTVENLRLGKASSRFDIVLNHELPGLWGKIIPPTSIPVTCSLPGRYQVYNALLASLVALTCGVNCKAIVQGLSRVRPFKRSLTTVYNKYFQVIDERGSQPEALHSLKEILQSKDYDQIVLLLALPGRWPPGSNNFYHDFLVPWARDLPLGRVILTRSIQQVSKKHRAGCPVEKKLWQAFQDSCCPVSIIPDLSHALEASLTTVGEKDLVLLLGGKGMDFGASLCRDVIESFAALPS